MHYDSNPLIMNLTHSEETNDLHVQVVSLKVGIAAADKNYDFTGSFLESKDTGSITVTITDHKDRKLSVDVSDISLQYLLKLNSWKESGADKNYGGGYDATHLSDQNGAGENDTYTLSSSDGKTYTLNSVKLTYAGIYEPNKMEFTLGGKTVSYNMTQLNDMGMPVFNLKTTKPTLTIDSIVPTQNQNYITLDGDGDNKTVQSKIEGKKITIYPEIEKSGSGCDESYDFRNEAQVKLKLTGLGKASKATLTFTTTDNRGTVHLYTGTSGVSGTRTDAYIWEQGGSEVVSRIVGYYNTNNCSSSVNAGTLTSANTITFEHVVGGTTQTYTVDVDTITIVNNAP